MSEFDKLADVRKNLLYMEGALPTKHQQDKDPGQHYRYEYKGLQIDPYRIAKIYGMTDHMDFFILKKILRLGRAHKDMKQELKDIINAAERRLQMLDEDNG